jgi:hypothetical protein
MISNRRGQAMIECVPVVLGIVTLLGILVGMAQWFLIHQKMICATRQGAWLYSSGRHPAGEVKRYLALYLTGGRIALKPERLQIEVGRNPGPISRFYSLDRIEIRYQPDAWLRRWIHRPMEEKCVIKHSPSYAVVFGPPVRW